jgi:lipopolysaccharide export system protein LptA
MTNKLAAIGLVAAAALAASSGATQIAPSSNAPVDVTADELEVRQGECLAVWRGRAEALQASSRLRANTINIYNRKLAGGSSCGALDRMEAIGDVFYVTPQQKVRGDRAVYAANGNTITVTGDVVIDQDGNVIRARRLVINVDSGQATMDGQGGSGRVRGVFNPNQASTKRP